jgi:CRISPR-associated exonuclease Cas4
MIAEYQPDELLPLSGLQHFLFCRRQWALIHVERQWQDNALTAEGKILHRQVDDPFFTEARPGVIIARAVPVASYSLGLIGVCDVVELVAASDGGVHLAGRNGAYRPAPVEFKRGRPKSEPFDEVQLCAQAICLEEMLVTDIPTAYLYYGQTRHRQAVPLTAELRELTRRAAAEMHGYYRRGYTPRVRPFKGCRACSLADVCLPGQPGKATGASAYIESQLKDL